MPSVVDDAGNLSPSLRSFRPTSLAVTQAVTAASAAVALTETITKRQRPVRIVNSGSQEIFVRTDGGVVSTANFHFSMLANTVETFTLDPADSLTVIAAATGSTIRITVGEGC